MECPELLCWMGTQGSHPTLWVLTVLSIRRLRFMTTTALEIRCVLIECGLVIGDRVIDVGSEWRMFKCEKTHASDVDPRRVGGTENHLLNRSVAPTLIAGGKGEAAFDERGYAKYSQSRSGLSSGDRSLISAFQEISQMAVRINCPLCIADSANTLFKQVQTKMDLKGRCNEGIASACLYIACRQQGVPRTFKEICAVSKVSKKEIGRIFKMILKSLDTSLDQITTNDFMSRFCAILGLTNAVQQAAATIAGEAVNRDIVPGRSPVSIAAAAIYMASQASDFNQKRTAKDISEVAGVADVTIRQSYKLMYSRASELFPRNFVFVTPIDKLPLA